MDYKSETDRKKRRDLILIGVIVAIVAVLLLVNQLIFSSPPKMVEISVDGEVVETLPLNQDTEITVEGYNGGHNHIVIEGGKVRVTEADCPDKICVNQGWIERTGENIVCLPNRMIARITGGE